ncbi:MAG: prephenate dehydrogenase/arogenate dehydrogenase family protein, partial [Solirubrobacterales bacterium]|nr:prephenate dehydrogenase/arogenate dehydrogenase family protein [Solirubrobacterales bacterium]
MRIALVGVGLIGGSVGMAARRRLGAHVTAWDPDGDALTLALERGAIDEAAAGVSSLRGAGAG